MPSNRETKSRWRSFEDSRAFVHTLGLKNAAEWRDYAQSGNKPDDIPTNPNRSYKAEWQSWGDWLGTGIIASQKREYRPFSEARAFVHALGLRKQAEWFIYCHRSGRKPHDIPYEPRTVYKAEWQSWGDWLGTGYVATYQRDYRPFPEARDFVRSLGLKNAAEWRDYCGSGKKPDDIPSVPYSVYAAEWRLWGDWLGTGTIAPQKREYRPFPEARDFVRSLGLKSESEWGDYCGSGKKPDDIPSAPPVVYPAEWRHWGDWLGTVNVWTKIALLAFLEDLRPSLPYLEDRELYEILRQGGQLPAMRTALGNASPMSVLRDLKGGGTALDQALKALKDEEKTLPVSDVSGSDDAVALEADLADATVDATQPTPTASCFLPGRAIEEVDRESCLPSIATPEGLRTVDALANLHYGLDDEAAEFLVTNRVHALWVRYFSEGRESVDALLTGDGEPWFTEIRRRFLGEADSVDRLRIPKGWSYTVDGKKAQPNLMQRRAAWQVRERSRIGNWSGVGTGKTLSAVLASRLIDAHATLVVTNNATVEQWEEEIKKAYPDSDVHIRVGRGLTLNPKRHSYVILKYERFQVASGSRLVRQLLQFRFDLVVFDEVQFVKQRDANRSRRRQELEAFVSNLAEQNPELRVLGMSATPVINNLLEARKLLEITTGREFADLGNQATVGNALAMHSALMLHGFRQPPQYDQEIRTLVLLKTHNELLEPLRKAQRHVLTIEQVLLQAKLDIVKPHLGKGVLVYSEYVAGILPKIRRYVEALGLRVGLYTGSDKVRSRWVPERSQRCARSVTASRHRARRTTEGL